MKLFQATASDASSDCWAMVSFEAASNISTSDRFDSSLVAVSLAVTPMAVGALKAVQDSAVRRQRRGHLVARGVQAVHGGPPVAPSLLDRARLQAVQRPEHVHAASRSLQRHIGAHGCILSRPGATSTWRTPVSPA